MKKTTLLKYVLPPAAFVVSAWVGVEIYNATIMIVGEVTAEFSLAAYPLLGFVSALIGVFLGLLGFAGSFYTIARLSGFSEASRKKKQSKRQGGRAS